VAVPTEIQEEIVKVKLVDPMPLHPLLCYPGSTTPLRAIALRGDGSAVWPLLGGDGTEGGGEEGADDEEGEEGEEETEDDEEETSEESKSKKSKKTGPVSRDEFDRVKKHLSMADSKKAALEKENADLKKFKEEQERKGNTELQNVKKDLGTLQEDHTKLQGRFSKLALVNAFLTASAQSGITWNDPKVAQKAGDFDDLEIDEDGNVAGMADAVKELAKKHKYLVRAEKDSDDEEEGRGARTKRGASGNGVGSTRTTKGTRRAPGELTPEELRKRFPTLNR
jgi:hypothetical protein